jgi:hypothetical protein
MLYVSSYSANCACSTLTIFSRTPAPLSNLSNSSRSSWLQLRPMGDTFSMPQRRGGCHSLPGVTLVTWTVHTGCHQLVFLPLAKVDTPGRGVMHNRHSSRVTFSKSSQQAPPKTSQSRGLTAHIYNVCIVPGTRERVSIWAVSPRDCEVFGGICEILGSICELVKCLLCITPLPGSPPLACIPGRGGLVRRRSFSTVGRTHFHRGKSDCQVTW